MGKTVERCVDAVMSLADIAGTYGGEASPQAG
jgi:hypothetical protein